MELDSKEVEKKEVEKPSTKILQKLSFVTLILISGYWSAQTVEKYLSEPTSTTITYQFGDDGQKIEFPMITVCGPNILYEKVFQDACELSERVRVIYLGRLNFWFKLSIRF